MKRWLALHRWLLLGFTVAVVCVRIIVELAFRILDDGQVVARPVGLAIFIVSGVAMSVAVVVTIIAFVQYGRIFNPRIPTE